MSLGSFPVWLIVSIAFLAAFCISFFQAQPGVRALLTSFAGVLFYVCSPYMISACLRWVLSFREWTLGSLVWMLAPIVAVQIFGSDLLSLHAISLARREWRAERGNGQIRLVSLVAMLIGWVTLLFPVEGAILMLIFPGFHVFYLLPCC